MQPLLAPQPITASPSRVAGSVGQQAMAAALTRDGGRSDMQKMAMVEGQALMGPVGGFHGFMGPVLKDGEERA